MKRRSWVDQIDPRLLPARVQRDRAHYDSAPPYVWATWERYGIVPKNEWESMMVDPHTPDTWYIVRGPLSDRYLLEPAPDPLTAITSDCRTDQYPAVGFADVVELLPRLPQEARQRAELALTQGWGPNWREVVQAADLRNLPADTYEDEDGP